jgi:hypothetical protein
VVSGEEMYRRGRVRGEKKEENQVRDTSYGGQLHIV